MMTDVMVIEAGFIDGDGDGYLGDSQFLRTHQVWLLAAKVI